MSLLSVDSPVIAPMQALKEEEGTPAGAQEVEVEVEVAQNVTAAEKSDISHAIAPRPGVTAVEEATAAAEEEEAMALSAVEAEARKLG